MNINRVILTGNLTRDPSIKQTQGGTDVAEFSIACNSREKRGDNWVDRVDFFDVTAFGSSAGAIGQYLSKGSPVAVDGRLRLDRWEKDGQKHSRVRIIADSVQFLPSRDGNAGGQRERQTNVDYDFTSTDDDIPF